MGMTAHDEAKPGRGGIQIQGVHVVQHVDQHCADFRDRRQWQCPCPLLRVYIPAHGHDRSQFPQLLQNLGIPDVTGMNNQLRPAQSLHGLAAEQSVRIGNQSETIGVARHAQILKHGSCAMHLNFECLECYVLQARQKPWWDPRGEAVSSLGLETACARSWFPARRTPPRYIACRRAPGESKLRGTPWIARYGRLQA